MDKIIERCKTGEKEAFRELFDTIHKRALGTAYLISGSRGIAEDILQEAYIKCINEIKKLRNPQNFNIWFYRILVRTGWSMAKKHSQMILTDELSESNILPYNSDNDILSNLEFQEGSLLLKKAIDNLSLNLKTVTILHYFNEMSIEEISQVLGCLKPTVKSRLFYARRVLKRQLSSYFLNDNHNEIKFERECNLNGKSKLI